MTLDLDKLTAVDKQNWLQYAIAPRPIALVSTIDKKGKPNLAPFSFFNLVSANPPIIVFSPARRVRDNTTKHSFENLYEVPEVVVNVVTYDMVHQVSLSSCDYPKDVDEFVMAGFTKEKALKVKPYMVKESPVKFECKIKEIKPLGKEGGAGNLIIAEIVCMHVSETILNDAGSMIDQTKLPHVARLGGDWYARINKHNLFRLPKPHSQNGIGIDALPETIRTSDILKGKHLAQLANVHQVPEVNHQYHDELLNNILACYESGSKELEQSLHQYLLFLVEKEKLAEAWQVLLRSDQQFFTVNDSTKSVQF